MLAYRGVREGKGESQEGMGGCSVTKSGGKSTSMMAAWVASGHLAGGVRTLYNSSDWTTSSRDMADVATAPMCVIRSLSVFV